MFRIEQELTTKSCLATDRAGRRVILKLLPSDCLLGDQLNPSVADRLRRVREIAMTNVANLRGVERDAESAFLVWDYIDGVPFDAYAGDPRRTERDVRLLLRELIHTIEHFHATGLVHGAIHAGNVLVAPTGMIWLTDVSPLLFHDPQRDERAVIELCRQALAQRGNIDALLVAAVDESARTESPMRALSIRLSRLEAGQPLSEKPRLRVRTRRRSLMAALIMLLVAMGIAISITQIIQRQRPQPIEPPRLAE